MRDYHPDVSMDEEANEFCIFLNEVYEVSQIDAVDSGLTSSMLSGAAWRSRCEFSMPRGEMPLLQGRML